MKIPEEVREIAADAHAKHPRDLTKAVEMAQAKVRKLANYQELVDLLVSHAVEDAVYSVRHLDNVARKQQAGIYGGPAKVVVGNSEDVRIGCQQVQDYYLHSIAGEALGDLLGADLEGIADNEEGMADGHLFNARLLRMLRPMVPDDKRVRDAVNEVKLRNMFRKVRKAA